MKELIEEYLEKVLIYGLKINCNDNLIIIMDEECPELYEVMERLKCKFHISKVIYEIENLKDIYTAISQNKKLILPKYILPTDKNHVKVLQFLDNSFSDYMRRLYYEDDKIYDKYINYINDKKETNSEFYRILEENSIVVSIYPSNRWATQMYHGVNAKERLLLDILDMIPKNINEEIEKLKNIKDYLNSLKIKSLSLYSNSGTDLEVELNEYSKWSITDINFPSYEIYTSPDIRYAHGKLCIEKPSVLYGECITMGILTFSDGKLEKVSSDNPQWEAIVLNDENAMKTIGEIGLVSRDNPIAKKNKIYNNILIDENMASHIALGDSLLECISIPEKYLVEKGKKYFNFSESYYHQDLVFGNNTLEVHCKSADGKSKILLQNGKWCI